MTLPLSDVSERTLSAAYALPIKLDTSGRSTASSRGPFAADVLAETLVTPPANWTQRINHSLVILCALFVSLYTTPAEILLGLLALWWLVSRPLGLKRSDLSANGPALANLCFFALILIGWIYSTDRSTGLKTIEKYRELLYVPLFAAYCTEASIRRLALWAFLAGVTILASLSYAEWMFGFDMSQSSSTDYVVFKDRIIHNLLMSVAIFLIAVEARAGRLRLPVAVLWGAFLLANMMFLVQGRTGYLAVIVLTTVFFTQSLKWRGLVCAALAILVLSFGAYQGSRSVRTRVHDTLAQLQNQFGPVRQRSPDPRLEYYVNSFDLVRANPLFGTGTGSFTQQYRQLGADRDIPPTDDPHCEYLMIAVQLGLVGLVAFVLLLGYQVRTSFRLPDDVRPHIQGVLAVIIVGSAFNSLLLGHTGGLLYGLMSGWAFAAIPGSKPEEHAANDSLRTVTRPASVGSPA